MEADPRWTQGRPRWNHVVVFPHSDFSEGFALPDCPRWMVVDRGEIGHLGNTLRSVALNQETNLPLLGDTAIAQLSSAHHHSGRTWPAPARRRRQGAGERRRRRRPHRSTGRHPRRDPAAESGGGAWRSGQREDVHGDRIGPTAGRCRPARRTSLLLPRSGVLSQADHRDVEASAAAGIRRRVPRARHRMGRARGAR